MGASQRRKGARRELEFAKAINGHKVPLSGATQHYKNDVKGLGLEWEVKARRQGFKRLYDWLENDEAAPDALALKADRKQWLVCLPLDKFLQLMNKE